MTDITLKLPAHAVRLIVRMCREKRNRANAKVQSDEQYTLQDDALYDSLNEIECSVPNDIWDQVKKEDA
jgi:hypothetical protein